MHSSRDQIAAAMQKLDSATLRGKLATGELTEMAKGLAEEILNQRELDGSKEPAIVAIPDENDPLDDAILDFVRRPFGWSWISWILAMLPCLVVVASFGTHAKNAADQSFLYGVIILQSLFLAGILRVIASIFKSSLSLGILGKLIAVGLLFFAIGTLTVCSTLAQSGWGGG
jgi:hypothetical protein